MSAKHTPGPWSVDSHGLIHNNSDTPIANLTSASFLPGSLFEREANACLLAAAPDLLEALQEVSVQLDQRADAEGNGPADYRPNWEMSLLQIVNAVIAKAEP